jgi:hypothetical protein
LGGNASLRGAESAAAGRVRPAADGERPEIRAGFGENTLSPSGAALRTINSNLEAARRLVPSVEELQQAARQRAAEQADSFERSAQRGDEERPGIGEPQPPREEVSFRPEPAPQARNFPPASDRAESAPVNLASGGRSGGEQGTARFEAFA